MLESKEGRGSGLPIRRIVFATDFLESSRLALDYAVAFAHRYEAQLTIVHAFELTNEAEQAELLSRKSSVSRDMALARLEGFAAGVRRSGIETRIDLRKEDPCTAVLNAAAEANADLLVLGTHGIYRGLEHFLVGSNAEKILLSARCPTLTVGRHVMAGIDLDLRFSDILLVSDLSDEAVGAASYALSLGKTLGIPVELMRVAPDEGSLDAGMAEKSAEQFCGTLTENPAFSKPEWCDPDDRRQLTVRPDEILKRAMQSANSLLVLGVHSESRWNRHLHTSLAYELVARATCPLLSIHRRG